MQQLIFFVGPDMCGKTNIAQTLSQLSGIPYFKATSEHTSFLGSRVSKNDQFLNQLRFADPRVYDMLRQTKHSVIFDRGFPCEFAYSQVFGRETDMTMLRHMDEAYAGLGAKIIFCRRTSYSGIKDDLDESIQEELLWKLDYSYHEFFRWSKCKRMILTVDDEDLDREINEISQFVGF